METARCEEHPEMFISGQSTKPEVIIISLKKLIKAEL